MQRTVCTFKVLYATLERGRRFTHAGVPRMHMHGCDGTGSGAGWRSLEVCSVFPDRVCTCMGAHHGFGHVGYIQSMFMFAMLYVG